MGIGKAGGSGIVSKYRVVATAAMRQLCPVKFIYNENVYVDSRLLAQRLELAQGNAIT